MNTAVTITRFLIGCVFSDACFDWLVGNMSVYREKLICFNQEVKKTSIFLYLSNYF